MARGFLYVLMTTK